MQDLVLPEAVRFSVLGSLMHTSLEYELNWMENGDMLMENKPGG